MVKTVMSKVVSSEEQEPSTSVETKAAGTGSVIKDPKHVELNRINMHDDVHKRMTSE